MKNTAFFSNEEHCFFFQWRTLLFSNGEHCFFFSRGSVHQYKDFYCHLPLNFKHSFLTQEPHWNKQHPWLSSFHGKKKSARGTLSLLSLVGWLIYLILFLFWGKTKVEDKRDKKAWGLQVKISRAFLEMWYFLLGAERSRMKQLNCNMCLWKIKCNNCNPEPSHNKVKVKLHEQLKLWHFLSFTYLALQPKHFCSSSYFLLHIWNTFNLPVIH